MHRFRVKLLVMLFGAAALAAVQPCEPVRLPRKPNQLGAQGACCRCNESHCDSVEPVGDIIGSGAFVVYTTSLHNDSERLSRSQGQLEPVPLRSAAAQHIVINVSATFQTITGFGAAFTDASTLAVRALRPQAQAHLLQSYWGESGLRYSIGRIPIGSTDFSTSVYSYNDERWASAGVEDVNLTHFSVEVDERTGRLPLIRAALQISAARPSSAASAHPPLQLFGSCWAPPPWMTTTNSTLNAALRDRPGGPIHNAYARYLSKFASVYRQHGVPVWALTAGNEPAGNSGKWQDLKFTAAQQRVRTTEPLEPVSQSVSQSVSSKTVIK